MQKMQIIDVKRETRAYPNRKSYTTMRLLQ